MLNIQRINLICRLLLVLLLIAFALEVTIATEMQLTLYRNYNFYFPDVAAFLLIEVPRWAYLGFIAFLAMMLSWKEVRIPSVERRVVINSVALIGVFLCFLVYLVVLFLPAIYWYYRLNVMGMPA